MAQFAKIFEIPENNQVLITLEYDSDDDCHNLKCETEIDGLRMSMSLGYNTFDEAEAKLLGFTQTQAKEVRNALVDLTLK